MRYAARRLAAAFALLLGLVAADVITNPTPATATDSSCAPGIGTKTPVILVHGFASGASVWGSDSDDKSMVHAIDQLPNIYNRTFEYRPEHLQWVDTPDIGPKLAQLISCEAAASRVAGGPGKVVLVGHSMGGLATRFAAAQTVNGRSVASDIGLVITLGTPNLGSGEGNLAVDFIHGLCDEAEQYGCSQILDARTTALGGFSNNSPELKKLPWLPRNIPTLAIAGNATFHLHVFKTIASWTTGSDLVVAKASALQDIREVSGNGGSATISCDENVPLTHSLPPCWHSGLPHNTDVEQKVAHAINSYVTSVRNAAFSSFAGDWSVHGAGATINRDGSGSIDWNYGPCDSDPSSSSTAWCTAHATFTLKAGSGGKLIGTYTRVWFTSSTGRLPPSFAPDPSEPKQGTTFWLKRNDPHTLISGPITGAELGNPYLCDNFAQQHKGEPGYEKYMECGA